MTLNSISMIAGSLGVSEGTVRQHLFRASAKLERSDSLRQSLKESLLLRQRAAIPARGSFQVGDVNTMEDVEG